MKTSAEINRPDAKAQSFWALSLPASCLAEGDPQLADLSSSS
jgi:hypothetical protein